MTSKGNTIERLPGFRVAVLIKQVPRFDNMRLGSDGRLIRKGVELEINPYCRRAISKGVELARSSGGKCVVFTLGPPCAEDALREAVAWGADRGVLISDPAFAGSDTFATAQALAAALRRSGKFDLVLTGLNSVDADTGQVPAQIAELLDLPFAAAVRELHLTQDSVDVVLGQDNARIAASLALPCVLAVAERLCAPAKKSPAERGQVPASRIVQLTARELGAGPWGQAGSLTRVGAVRAVIQPKRMRVKLKGLVVDQCREAVALLLKRDALAVLTTGPAKSVPTAVAAPRRTLLCVLIDPYSLRAARALCAEAARLAQVLKGVVVAVAPALRGDPDLGGWGADRILRIHGCIAVEDFVGSIKSWFAQQLPWAVLAPSSPWGREAAARLACHLGAGLIGDAVSLEIGDDGRMVALKPAVGGSRLATITADSPVQMATIRRGVLPLLEPRTGMTVHVTDLEARQRGRVLIHTVDYVDDVEPLLAARRVIGVGQGVLKADISGLDSLRIALRAEMAATRRVTDQGWLPRARQVGLTGSTIAPDLYVAVGISGKFNHTVGIQSAATILAINSDPEAPIFDLSDIGIVADWREAVPTLTQELVRLEQKRRVTRPCPAV